MEITFYPVIEILAGTTYFFVSIHYTKRDKCFVVCLNFG